MMREKCTEGKGGKGERRADECIVPVYIDARRKGETHNKAEKSSIKLNKAQ
jgi:hypothetical protein